MWSCKEITLLTSKSMDGTLSRRERLAIWLHLLYCRSCARFRDQIQFLRRAARTHESPPADDRRLPEAARERIRVTLRKGR